MPETLVPGVVAAALFFAFLNGWNDLPSTIATPISTRILTPGRAVILTVVFNVLGAFYSTRVAETMAQGIVDPGGVTVAAVLAALLAAIIWNAVMTVLGLPISSSHALIGGLVGAGLAQGGWAILSGSGIRLVLFLMLVYPVLGGVLGYALMRLIYGVAGGAPPHVVKRIFRRMQLATVAFLSFSHGTADVQKVVGVIVLVLLAAGQLPSFAVPTWVVWASGLAMGLGTAVGGWYVVKTRNTRMIRLGAPQAVPAETGAALLLTAAGHLGLPVSSTHTVTGAVLGVGAATRISAVRWGVANEVVYAWVFTLPGTALISYLFQRLLAIML